MFKNFKAMAEKESNKFIKVLRSNGGGEYMSNEFMDFCKYHGIKRHFIARYSLQQNSVAERKNQTIMNMARSMMKEKHISNEYWGDIITCSVYILNGRPTKSVKDRLPQQAWSGKCSNMSHLIFFWVCSLCTCT